VTEDSVGIAGEAVPRAIVVGSSGGIGGALAEALEGSGYAVARLARSPDALTTYVDVTDERSIAAAAETLKQQAPYQRIIVATGILQADETKPEKTYRDMRGDTLLNYFEVNAIGPALVAKHLLPLLPQKGRCVFAALSARVGSISDNHLGGWYGYRASKAALNMLIKNLAIEVERTRPQAICATLHPGSVDTSLSKPFQKNVPPDRLFSPDLAAEKLLKVMDELTPAQSGDCFAWDGKPVLP
jgi:NAD(P)-dependent dehydrogenase (short-subunit alcohol dehydrogenase family)